MTTLANTYLSLLLLACSLTLGNATNPDVDALIALMQVLSSANNVFSTWQPSDAQNPCHWRNIECSPQNGVVYFGCGISGTLPAEIGNLTSLEFLDLSNNSFSGPIPPELGNLSELRTLDLHKNNFNGSIPIKFDNLSNLQLLNLSYNQLKGVFVASNQIAQFSETSFEGNSGLCVETVTHECVGRGRIKPGKLVGIVLAAGAVFLTILVGVILWRNKPRIFSLLRADNDLLDRDTTNVEHYRLRQIMVATEQFNDSHILCKSTTGVVYKGAIDKGPMLAFKRLSNAPKKSQHTFDGEVEVISRASHRNVANLVGYCSTLQEKILVFEYYPRGSLDSVLHGHRQSEFPPLGWEERKCILLGVAKGLAYLHGSNPKVVHSAVKANNVLLGSDLTPKLTDFSIGHSLQRGAVPSLAGDEWAVMGYMAPEIIGSENHSSESDCYSYGFLLVEVVSGRRPWQLLSLAKDAHYDQLRDWVRGSYAREDLVDLIDAELRHPPLWEVKKILELAATCMDNDPFLRPPMNEVIEYLVEEVLIPSRSTDFDSLFIDIVMHPQNSFQLTPKSESSFRQTSLSPLSIANK